ncbi:MAG TPA: hypothetical protein PLC98_23065, partial [Anaerolineales bacterium]|nr:hypothetical protein [Anaerolineales bacterium]
APDGQVTLALPGGGGHGDPGRREVERVLADVVAGYVSPAAALADYGLRIAYVGDPMDRVRPPERWRVRDG